MNFGEKLQQLRLEKNLSQKELGQLIGKTERTIQRYESGDTYPRDRAVYRKLAEVLGVKVGYLMTDTEEFMSEVGSEYGSRGQRQAEEMLGQARELFAGGELSDEDKVAFMSTMHRIFLDSKQEARERFTPKKHRKKRKGGTSE